MQFHAATDMYFHWKKNDPDFLDSGPHDSYARFIKNLEGRTHVPNTPFLLLTAAMCDHWRYHQRPFFNCWPVVLDMIENADVDEIPVCNICTNICDPVWIRFPEQNEPAGRMTGLLTGTFSRRDDAEVSFFFCGFFYDESLPCRVNRLKLCGSWINLCAEGMPVTLGELKKRPDYDPHVYMACKIAMCCYLASQDDSMIERRLLARDASKELKTGEALDLAIQRAIRRGVNGWDLGKKVQQQRTSLRHGEVSPHYRRPHFGIRWKGKNRSTPALVPIKGSLVLPKKLRLPTGYLDRHGHYEVTGNNP